MDFFLVTQDNRIINRIEPIGITKDMFKEALSEDDEPMLFYLKEKSQNDYVDLIERPVFLVSDRCKKVLKMYSKQTIFAPVVLGETQQSFQEVYWYVRPPKIDCLSEQAEFNKNGTLKRLVINPGRVAGHRVFQIDQIMESFIVIDLVVLESLLRRGLVGFRPELVQMELELTGGVSDGNS
jgi:hypothetical protein